MTPITEQRPFRALALFVRDWRNLAIAALGFALLWSPVLVFQHFRPRLKYTEVVAAPEPRRPLPIHPIEQVLSDGREREAEDRCFARAPSAAHAYCAELRPRLPSLSMNPEAPGW